MRVYVRKRDARLEDRVDPSGAEPISVRGTHESCAIGRMGDSTAA